jgi:hypothetical protein
MNISIIDNKLGSTSNPPIAIVIKASNNFYESFIQEAPYFSLEHFLNVPSSTKQSCNPNPHSLALSSLPLPMHVESDCPLSMWIVDNHFACCTIFFSFLSSNKILALPLTPQRKKEKKILRTPTHPKLKRKKIYIKAL